MFVIGYQWLKYNGRMKNSINRSLQSRKSSSASSNRSSKGSSRMILQSESNCSENVTENNGISKDIFGLISGLLEYNYNVIAFTVTLSLAVVFSIIFPWSGMNSSLIS
mmetsp:Transcript_33598/g.32076  ORF Transcript_33598/g.32076 Transcript_33598/m.32076 type:complete len:108 (-) Transcript_33598:236-559(-)